MLIAKDIIWDVDEEEKEYANDLPREVVIPPTVEAGEACDWLSDAYGFCIKEFYTEEE